MVPRFGRVIDWGIIHVLIGNVTYPEADPKDQGKVKDHGSDVAAAEAGPGLIQGHLLHGRREMASSTGLSRSPLVTCFCLKCINI